MYPVFRVVNSFSMTVLLLGKSTTDLLYQAI